MNNSNPLYNDKLKKVDIPNIPTSENKEGDLLQEGPNKLELASQKIIDVKTVTQKVTGVIEKDPFADENDILETKLLKDEIFKGLDSAKEEIEKEYENIVPVFSADKKPSFLVGDKDDKKSESRWNKSATLPEIPDEEKPSFLKKNPQPKKIPEIIPPDTRPGHEENAEEVMSAFREYLANPDKTIPFDISRIKPQYRGAAEKALNETLKESKKFEKPTEKINPDDIRKREFLLKNKNKPVSESVSSEAVSFEPKVISDITRPSTLENAEKDNSNASMQEFQEYLKNPEGKDFDISKLEERFRAPAEKALQEVRKRQAEKKDIPVTEIALSEDANLNKAEEKPFVIQEKKEEEVLKTKEQAKAVISEKFNEPDEDVFKTREELCAFLADPTMTDEELAEIAKQKISDTEKMDSTMRIRNARMLEWKKIMEKFSPAQQADFARETKAIRNKYSFPGLSRMKSNAEWIKHTKDWDKKSDAERKEIILNWPHMGKDEQMRLIADNWDNMSDFEKEDLFLGWDEFTNPKKAEINKKRKEELIEAFLKHGLVPNEGVKRLSPDNPREWVNASVPRKFDPKNAEHINIAQDIYKKDKLGRDRVEGVSTGPLEPFEGVIPEVVSTSELSFADKKYSSDTSGASVLKEELSEKKEVSQNKKEDAQEVKKSYTEVKRRRTPDEIRAEIADLEKITGSDFFGDKSELLAKLDVLRAELMPYERIEILKNEVRTLEKRAKSSSSKGIEDEILKREDEIRRLEREISGETDSPSPIDIKSEVAENEVVNEEVVKASEPAKPENEILKRSNENLKKIIDAELKLYQKKAETVATGVTTEAGPTTPEASAVETEHGELNAGQKINGALVLGLIPRDSIPTNPSEYEAFVKRLDLTRFSEEALAKASQLFDAERSFNATFRGITEQAKLNGIARDKTPGYENMWNEPRLRLLELNALLERDERKRWEALYPNDEKKVNEAMLNMQEGSFRHWLVRGLTKSVLDRRNSVRQEALKASYPERKDGFFSNFPGVKWWVRQPKWRRAVISASILGAGTAVLGGMPLAVAGSFTAYKVLRGLTGAAAGSLLQGISEKTFLKWFKKSGEKKVNEAISTEYMSGRTEYWNLLWGKHYEHLADKNIRMAELLGQKADTMKTKLAKKENRLRFASTLLTGVAGGYGGGALLDSFLSGGESLAAEIIPPFRLGGGDMPVAVRGDSVWTLIEKNLETRMPGFSELPSGQQTYIVDHYKDIVVSRPQMFGLSNPNLIQPGYGKELASLFDGPNSVPMEEVLQSSKTVGTF